MPRLSILQQRLRVAAAHLPLDAKRKRSRQRGVEGWFPYYAGYSEAFTRGVLGELGRNIQLRVLDPWNGAGTTTRVAHQLGHDALGYDINPVSNLVASAKLAHPDDALHVIGLAKRWAASRPVITHPTDPLLPWLAPSVVAQYRAIESRLLDELATTSDGNVTNPLDGGLPPLASFLLLALLRTARTEARINDGSNPTWTRPGNGRRKPMRNFGRLWLERVSVMADELLEMHGNGLARPWSGTIGIADSRNLPVERQSVDLVLSSPPYCTRIDYVISTSFELAALGLEAGSDKFFRLRRATMGTPLTRNSLPEDSLDGWPEAVGLLLNAIRKHQSKSSSSYYFRTYWQYFSDALASIREIKRVLRPGGVAVLVIQSSYYKDILVDLPGLYVAMGEQVGLRATIIGESQVRRAMAQINPHTSRYRTKAEYREAIVALEKAA